jgi:signal transduction histidine kinase
MLNRDLVEGLSIKSVLIVGFSVALGIWFAAGFHFTRRMKDAEARAGAINSRYMQAQELLSTVRAQVLLGSVYVRDALLDPNPSSTDYRGQLEATYGAVNQALEQYVPILDSTAERERVGRLQNEIEAFRRTMLDVLATDSSQWPREARVLLRTQIVPRRETVIRVSEEVQALNRLAFVQQQQEVAQIYATSQRWLWESLGVALATSSAIAVLVAIYAGRLERRLREQRLRDAQSASALQHLSAKLISAQEEERRSIARELHDEVGQVLMTIRVELAMAQRAIEARGGDGELLRDARSITDGAVSTVRNLSHLLHPALLDDLGLVAAIEWYVKGFSKRFDIQTVVLHDDCGERLAAEIEASAYRIVQEALTNVVKHAQATTCRVYLQRLTSTLLMTIEDNGVGFDQAELNRAGARTGLGLISIRERATQLGGTVRVESDPGRGTRVTVELPVRARAEIQIGLEADGLSPDDNQDEPVAHG